jgi:hypothetical protein
LRFGTAGVLIPDYSCASQCKLRLGNAFALADAIASGEHIYAVGSSWATAAISNITS